MYRRAARWSGYSAAPSYSSGTYVSPPVSPLPPVMGPPFAPYGTITGGYPPPYFFFSGVARPGFGAPWLGMPRGPAANMSPVDQPLANQPPINSPPVANQPPRASQPTANQDEPDEPISDQAFISGLYQEILGREPDEPGLTAWVHALRRGMSRRAVANYFLNSRERSRPQPPHPRRPATPSEHLNTNAASARPARGAIDVPGNPEPMPQPVPQPGIEPEVIPLGEEPAVDNEPPLIDPPLIDDGEALPEEVPVPPAASPPKREREF